MWLLNSCSWELRDFISVENTPPYAILSHTWGDEEVSHRDWQEQPFAQIEKKLGFRKIKLCCKQAFAEGLEWVWVDTCCIDKSSSAELSEAINSMFKWYKEATICYAYLSDVEEVPISHTTTSQDEDDLCSSMMSLLSQCHWISRGWTLQELIAPSEVMFYSRDWEFIGSRTDLSTLLASATRINEPYLQGRNIRHASIAKIMSWVAKRATTREEDIAYCLLGLFGVNMTLLYGEGKRAFRRLQEILAHEYPRDHTLYAWGNLSLGLPNLADEGLLETVKLTSAESTTPLDRQFYGLLAQSHLDFQDCGETSCAPDLEEFFDFIIAGDNVNSYSPPTFIGETAQASFPIFLNVYRGAFAPTVPPIAQIYDMGFVVLFCGKWDSSHQSFFYSLIPVVNRGDLLTRTSEIFNLPYWTWPQMGPNDLLRKFKRNRFAASDPIALRDGDVLLRNILRHNVRKFSWRIPHGVSYFHLSSCFRFRAQFTGGFASYMFQLNATIGLSVCLLRETKDPNGQIRSSSFVRRGLSIGLTPLSYSPNPPHPVTIRSTKRSNETVLKDSHLTLPVQIWSGIIDSFLTGKQQFAFTHTITGSAEEWEFEIIGAGVAKVSVERILCQFEENLSGLGEDSTEGYVDIVTIA
ncbi:heterokaryon incompatibility protein-domain-containing protein [Xylariaceae sp. FL0255]|nr:heterokaryon incompatibility protein-domain-containing protein [Xylariaceae sp. FL0255]